MGQPGAGETARKYILSLITPQDEMTVNFAGKAFPWPKRAEFRLDYAPPSELAFYAKIVDSEL